MLLRHSTSKGVAQQRGQRSAVAGSSRALIDQRRIFLPAKLSATCAAEEIMIGEADAVLSQEQEAIILAGLRKVTDWDLEDTGVDFGVAWLPSHKLPSAVWKRTLAQASLRATWAQPRVQQIFPSLAMLEKSAVRFHVNCLDKDGRGCMWHTDGNEGMHLMSSILSLLDGCPPADYASVGGEVELAYTTTGTVRYRYSSGRPMARRDYTVQYISRHNGLYVIYGSNQSHRVLKLINPEVTRYTAVTFYRLPTKMMVEGKEWVTVDWLACQRAIEMRGITRWCAWDDCLAGTSGPSADAHMRAHMRKEHGASRQPGAVPADWHHCGPGWNGLPFGMMGTDK
jgi:hypothetical protein